MNIIISLLLFGCFIFSCQQIPSHIDEQFGEGIILNDSSIVFFKGMTFYPEERKTDTSQIQTKLNIYFYKPYNKEVNIIKSFGIIKDWPSGWNMHLDNHKNIIGFSLENVKDKRITDEEGIYLYNRMNEETKKIEKEGSKFWISPDGGLVLYHLFNKENEKYKLYGYEVGSGGKTLLNENQPKIKDIEWLKNGEAALLRIEEKDSTILVRLK